LMANSPHIVPQAQLRLYYLHAASHFYTTEKPV
jgi:hypothetical protein